MGGVSNYHSGRLKELELVDPLLTYRAGAGFLAAPNNALPGAFKSLGDFCTYWEFNAGTPHDMGRPLIYTLNGIHPNLAICVHFNPPFASFYRPQPWILYTQPEAVEHAWYYLVDYLKASPGINMGPVAKGLKDVSHVAIVNNPRHLGSSEGYYGIKGGWFFDCTPNMKKFTRR
jgi:hypothetical protein